MGVSPFVMEVNEPGPDYQGSTATTIFVIFERNLVEAVREALAVENVERIARFVDGPSRSGEKLAHIPVGHLKNVATGTVARSVLVGVRRVPGVKYGDRERIRL